MHLNEARKALRLSCEEVLDLISRGELEGRPPRLLSASNGYDYCTGWLIERRSLERYLAAHGRAKKAKPRRAQVPASLLAAARTASPQMNTGF